MKRIICILFALCTCVVNVSAQEQVLQDDSTSAVLPSLAEMNYSDNAYLAHDYRYELLNKKRSYELKGKCMNMLGYLTFIGTAVGAGFMTVDRGWSEWASVPCATVVAMGLAAPFVVLEARYKKKAQAIDISTSYLFELDNGKVQIGPSVMRIDNDLCQQPQTSFGLSIKTTF